MAESGAFPLPTTSTGASRPAPGTGAPQPVPAHTPLARAADFLWLTARVLEQRRFAYEFLGAGDGGADAVETALDAYRTEDGGYGHALEPDLRGPVSQPLHAAHALGVLDSIGRCGGQRVERLCRHLTSVSTPDGALPSVLPRQRAYPSAPFVPIVDNPPGDLLATGPVVGLLHRNDVWHAWLFRATDFCWHTVESLEKSHPYEVEAAIVFLDSVPDRPRAQAAADRLGRLVREQRLAVLDPDRLDDFPVAPGYAPREHHFPHHFARSPGSLARAWFTDAEMSRSLDVLSAQQESDGGWPIHWRLWAPGTALEWRPLVTLDALRTLRAHGRPIG
ncbi:hypothetical protein [Streptomyces uncialis]|uniref:hypothetical protein n=1 Tax=Streptomyces uncialis TaxID=1048205 RepID=UPI002258D584|nr:hypothetical protein [Streptomyces uncialis]MCX4659727.1 hypothetical protein [Streptomyces uncialis]WST67811.1 hypothetical protein OG268_09965 [Streptomyces uncialis]